MDNRNPMTTKGHKRMQEELAHLKSVERIKIIKAIEEARAHGDLSENAEYDAAKNAQGLLEGRIKEIEARLSTAQVIDIEKLSGEKVIFGATVEILDLDTNENKRLTIVGEDEADAKLGLISFNSPLSRALIGKSVGDEINVRLPVGTKLYEVLSLEFIAT